MASAEQCLLVKRLEGYDTVKSDNICMQPTTNTKLACVFCYCQTPVVSISSNVQAEHH